MHLACAAYHIPTTKTIIHDEKFVSLRNDYLRKRYNNICFIITHPSPEVVIM